MDVSHNLNLTHILLECLGSGHYSTAIWICALSAACLVLEHQHKVDLPVVVIEECCGSLLS